MKDTQEMTFTSTNRDTGKFQGIAGAEGERLPNGQGYFIGEELRGELFVGRAYTFHNLHRVMFHQVVFLGFRRGFR